MPKLYAVCGVIFNFETDIFRSHAGKNERVWLDASSRQDCAETEDIAFVIADPHVEFAIADWQHRPQCAGCAVRYGRTAIFPAFGGAPAECVWKSSWVERAFARLDRGIELFREETGEFRWAAAFKLCDTCGFLVDRN